MKLSRAALTRRAVVVHNKGQARVRRTVSFLTIATVSFVVGGWLALTYAPPLAVPLIMGSMPTDVETLGLYEPPDDFSREVDEHIKNSALAQSLRADPDFTESRPHLKIPAEVRQHNLTAGTLAGPSMIVVPPYHFNERGGKSMVQIFYVGPDCSGHPGIVHGGFLATVLDEGLARCAFPAMPNKVGVTANLQINYLAPTMAGQFLVLRARTTKVDGRKAWAEGWIEPLEVAEGEEPKKLVEATALFIEPKHAKVS
jgi:acyl-coenzyme A thioesterase PaaI-like protein